MPLKESYLLPAAADFHVHVRDGDMSNVVVPTIVSGGVDTAYIMPNLTPPVTTVAMALEYRDRLRAIAPDVNFLMTLYLHPSITPEVVREAKAAGIVGIKSYPHGLTTNSEHGVVSYDPFFPVFEEMERVGLVLNIHGEVPSDAEANITVMNAEVGFLPVLKMLNEKFPRLKIVLEHVTTADACDAIRACGDTVVGTVTVHHMSLVVDDVVGNVFHFCKPVAKSPKDRRAILNAVVNSNGKFFLGTDSAPHNVTAKRGTDVSAGAAGVFTQPYAVQYFLTALEEAIERGDIKEESVTEDLLKGFLSEWGRKFYGVERSTKKILLTKDQGVIAESFKGEGIEVVPFKKGQPTWGLTWQ
ncbi:dihydroorotase [Thozetella sp. PMI_491]|nr:dihydroorotase [Thozetella sp. PMI_491]